MLLVSRPIGQASNSAGEFAQLVERRARLNQVCVPAWTTSSHVFLRGSNGWNFVTVSSFDAKAFQCSVQFNTL